MQFRHNQLDPFCDDLWRVGWIELFKTIILGAFFNSGHADETSQAEELSVLTSGQNLEVKLDDGENTPKRQPKEQAIMIGEITTKSMLKILMILNLNKHRYFWSTWNSHALTNLK